MLTQVYEPLIGLILPELCRRCGEPANAGFCSACRNDFPRNESACLTCGRGPLPHGCNACPSHPPHWHVARVVAPLVYMPPLERYIQSLKYDGERAIGRCVGQILADAAGDRRSQIDALVAVPLHRHRLRERGYNQALEIARTVSAALRIPLLRTGIIRCRVTAPQTSLSCAQRRANLVAAFMVTRQLRGPRLAIIDDVITTGATVNALAETLLQAGAVHVEAWAVARTQLPPGQSS
jgi:ComF family protein